MVFVVYFDGACRPKNPGGIATCGWTIKLDGEVIEENYCEVARGKSATNNVAEWAALQHALQSLLVSGVTSNYLYIYGDSKLVINQLNKKWRSRKPHLTKFRDACYAILKKLGMDWEAHWIPREENAKADKLSHLAYKEAIRQKRCKPR